MREKILIIVAFLALFFTRPIKVFGLACTGTGYTCRQNDCADGEIEDTSRICSAYDYICCKKAPAPTATNPPYASPTPIPPQCTCRSNGGCNGVDCQWTFKDCDLNCGNNNNARFEVRCGNNTCGNNTCGFYNSCIPQVTSNGCCIGCPGCILQSISIDCNYGSCAVCGVGRIGKIVCNGVHCGDICVQNSLCNTNNWCQIPTPTDPNNPSPTPTNILSTPTPTNILSTPTPTNILSTPTPIPAFVKLKNTSFYSNQALNNYMPSLLTSYDGDDDGSLYFIISSPNFDPGLISATSISLGQSQPSIKGWKTTASSNNTLFTPSAFSQYIKSRVSYKTITSLSDITSQNYNNQILFYNGDLNLTNPTIFNNRNLVLVINGNVNIYYNGAFSPLNSSLAILSTSNITFSSTTTEATGIFIASSIDTGSTINQGLKIIGNLIALNSFTNNRKWSITSRPSLFIIFDKNQYLNLLPMLSTVNYLWQKNN